jgi:hypothetical protein
MDEAFLGHGWLEIDPGDRAGGQVVAVVGLLDDGNPPKLVQRSQACHPRGSGAQWHRTDEP